MDDQDTPLPATMETILAQLQRVLDGQETIIAEVRAIGTRMEAVETALTKIKRDIVTYGR